MAASVCFLLHCFLACLVVSQAQITLTPASQCVSSDEPVATFSCETTTSALLWITHEGTVHQRFYTNDSTHLINVPESLGPYVVVQLNSIGVNVTLSSVATVNVSSLSLAGIKNLRLTCDGNGDGVDGKEALLIVANGPPSAPNVTSITQDRISWSMSDCAVQYVVTIINSSDGSVYLNITTSDTNTTVTLSTGVEYCVTVLGVDSIGRRGSPSQQQCYSIPSMSSSITIISSSIGSTTLTSSPSPSTPSVDPPPSGVSGGAIAGIAIGVLVLVIVVSAIVAVLLLIVLYQRRRGHSKLQELPLVQVKCVCQMYYQEMGINQWKVVFVFVLSEDRLESVKMFYKDFKDYGSSIDCYWKSSDTIQVKVTNKPDGWTVLTSDYKVRKATIEGYTGECSPPHIEMVITASSDKTTPPDLTVEAKLKGVRTEPNIIKFEKEAQNVVKCVYQVFYHKLYGINHWRATFIFTPQQHKKKVEDLYQDANNSSWHDILFGGGVIKVSTDDTVPAGWEVTINKQVTTAAVEQYTGECEPPYCEMTLRATDSVKSDDLLQLHVTLIGVRKDYNKFVIRRALVDRDGIRRCATFPFLSPAPAANYVCQVFYHKRGLNYWKATIAFYSKFPPVAQRVQHFYQDANSDPPVDIQLSFNFISTIKPKIIKVNGWTVNPNVQHKAIKYEKVVEYLHNGVGSPPHCELSIKAASDDITPPDLVLDITLSGVSGPCSGLKIIRKAERPDNAAEAQNALDYLDDLPGKEPDDIDFAHTVSSLKLESETHPLVAVCDTSNAGGDPPNACGDPRIGAGGDAESTKVKAEDTEKKPQSQFPMSGESSETTHKYHVDFENA